MEKKFINKKKEKKKILIIGLPGSGKSFLAKELNKRLKGNWLNADKIRKKFNEWDFSKKGVLRQAKRMRFLAGKSKKNFVTVKTPSGEKNFEIVEIKYI